MKKTIYLFLISVIFLSCSKKNDDTTTATATNATLIIGKWKDGPVTSNFYTAGKLVYTQSYPATNPPAAYYQFNTDGTFVVSTLQTNGTYAVAVTYIFSLTNSNNTLHYSSGTTSADNPISFTDNNTLVISTVSTVGVTYSVNGVATKADSETDLSTLVRQ